MSDHARYGPGRKPIESRRIDLAMRELYRRVQGFFDEVVVVNGDGIIGVIAAGSAADEVKATYRVRFPRVESSAWADEIAAAARAGKIAFSPGWRRLERDAALTGVYPPPGDVLTTVDRPAKRGMVRVPSSCRLRGKIPCKECSVPCSPTYQNVHGVCFDCQLAEQTHLFGHREEQSIIRTARRECREESLAGLSPPDKMGADLLLLGLTADQMEVANMYVRGFTLKEIGGMTNRTEQRVNTIIGRVRKKCRQLGLRPLDRDEDRSGKSRHVRASSHSLRFMQTMNAAGPSMIRVKDWANDPRRLQREGVV